MKHQRGAAQSTVTQSASPVPLREPSDVNPKILNPQIPRLGQTRKPYAAPTLISWGTLQDITRAVGRSGNRDGATGPNKWTRM